MQGYCFFTSIFRRNTFTSLYTSWKSSVAKDRKIGLVSTRVHRLLMICSPRLLNGEFSRIKNEIDGNGYHTNVIKALLIVKLDGLMNQLF